MIIWFSNLSTLSVPDEGYSRNPLCAYIWYLRFYHACYIYICMTLSTNIHVDSAHCLSWLSNKDCSFLDVSSGWGGVISHLPSYWVGVPNTIDFITIRWDDMFAMNINSTFFCCSSLVFSSIGFLFLFLFDLLFHNRWNTKCSM